MNVVLASDNFDRANENPLANGVWTTTNSNVAMQIVGNVATPTDPTVNDDGSYYSGITWPDDQFSRAKLTVNWSGGGDAGVALYARQASGANTKYRLVVDHAATNNVTLSKFVAGVHTTLTGFPLTQAWTDGDLWELDVSGTTLRIFLNGVQVGADATDSSITSGAPGIGVSTTVTSASINDWEGGTFSSLVGFYGSKRAPGTRGPRDPRGFIKRGVFDFSVPSSPTALNLTADVGSIVLTGFAPSIAFSLTGSTGSVVLTGFAPSIGFGLIGNTGSIVLAGFAPSIAFGLTGNTGSIVLSGFAPSIGFGLAGNTGSIVLTGFAPSIGFGLTGNTGAIVLTGYAPTVNLGGVLNLTAGVGDIVVTGYAPSIAFGLMAGTGSIVLTGFAPTLEGIDVTPVAGAGARRRQGKGIRGGLLYYIRLLKELEALQQRGIENPQNEKQHAEYIAKRTQLEAKIREARKERAAKAAAELAAEQDDEERILAFFLQYIGGGYGN